MSTGSDAGAGLRASPARRIAERVLPRLMRIPGGRRGLERAAVAFGHRVPGSKTVERLSRRVGAALIAVGPDDPYRVAAVEGGRKLRNEAPDLSIRIGRLARLGRQRDFSIARFEKALGANDANASAGAGRRFRY